ncbi:MAG: hypothetical protein ACLT98_02850 [Eggerthellaceae bacterium]
MTLRQRYELVENKVAQACVRGRNREGVHHRRFKTVDIDAVGKPLRSACTISAAGLRAPESSRRFLRSVGILSAISNLANCRPSWAVHADSFAVRAKHAEDDSLPRRHRARRSIGVNDGEGNKQGLEPDAIRSLAFCHGLKHVRVKGL